MMEGGGGMRREKGREGGRKGEVEIGIEGEGEVGREGGGRESL